MKFRIHTSGKVQKLCTICGTDKDLVDGKQSVSRSVDVIVKLCRVPCAPPITLVVSGYSYDVEPWEEDSQ